MLIGYFHNIHGNIICKKKSFIEKGFECILRGVIFLSALITLVMFLRMLYFCSDAI